MSITFHVHSVSMSSRIVATCTLQILEYDVPSCPLLSTHFGITNWSPISTSHTQKSDSSAIPNTQPHHMSSFSPRLLEKQKRSKGDKGKANSKARTCPMRKRRKHRKKQHCPPISTAKAPTRFPRHGRPHGLYVHGPAFHGLHEAHGTSYFLSGLRENMEVKCL